MIVPTVSIWPHMTTLARHHLSKRLREHVGTLFAKRPHNVAFG